MKQILDLTTEVDRPTVRIVSKVHPDGRTYEIRGPSEVGVVARQKVDHTISAIESFANADLADLSERDARQLAAALDDVVEAVMIDLEPSVLHALTDAQKTAIVEVFNRQFGGTVCPECGFEAKSPGGLASHARTHR